MTFPVARLLDELPECMPAPRLLDGLETWRRGEVREVSAREELLALAPAPPGAGAFEVAVFVRDSCPTLPAERGRAVVEFTAPCRLAGSVALVVPLGLLLPLVAVLPAAVVATDAWLALAISVRPPPLV